MLRNLIDFFLRLFPWIKPQTSDAEQQENVSYSAQYADTSDLNLTAIVANKIANIVTSDATMEVVGDSPRAALLNDALQRFAFTLWKVTQRTLGLGGVVLKPYLYAGKLHTEALSQDRYFIIERQGEKVTQAGFVAEVIKRNHHTYVRTEYHALDASGVYTIEQRATMDDSEVALSSVPEWAGLQPIQSIAGVEQMLFAPLMNPVDNRKQLHSPYGVPITYGQDKLMAEIVALISDMQREFDDKKTFIGVADTLFSGANKLPADGIYKKFESDDDNFFEVFSPDIRDESYARGIDYKLGLLEKAIGVNKGVLTELETKGATATEIRRSTADTFALVDSVRKGIENAVEQLVYAYNVIANAAGLSPAGEYALKFDWSYALLEDSQETFSQLMDALGAGEIPPGHVAAFVLDVPLEEAQAQLPGTDQLLQA